MNIDDMIMVSIDDHVVEPPDMFARHVPAKYGPIGAASWSSMTTASTSGCTRVGRTGVSGLNAVVSWPPEEWGRDPAGFAEMRPGVYDVHERVRDMSRNGILASMCFPTFTGFSAMHLSQFKDEATVVMVPGVQRLAHRRVGWRLSRPVHSARGHPDVGPGAHGAPRSAGSPAKGCRAVTMPELPHLEGLPSYHDESTGARCSEALSERRTW